ncbi:MAG: DNA internalization-related competence protein ComEC/Rec2, partial [Clostridia bacterium]|nr:DNA internalization-related competence protein ComEC/Rec2 [Clostridia bacterium]
PAPLWLAAWAAWLGAELALTLPPLVGAEGGPWAVTPCAVRALDGLAAAALILAWAVFRAAADPKAGGPPTPERDERALARGDGRGGEGGRARGAKASALALALVAAAGFARGEAVWAETAAFAPGEFVTLEGWVDDSAPAQGGWVVVLRGRDQLGHRLAVSAFLRERLLPDGRAPARGEGWRLTGRLARERPARNPGGFDARSYYLARGVAWELEVEGASRLAHPAAPLALRLSAALGQALAAAFDAALPPPSAALAKSLVLGERGALPPETRAEWRWAGAAHVLAVSGMHVSVLAGAALALFGGLAASATWLVTTLVWAYVLVVGAPPSALRAGLMLQAAAAGRALGRPPHALSALGFSALALLFWRPALALDVGFRLSYLATCGVVLWTSPVARRLGQAGLPPALAGPLAVGVAASAATAPASFAAFGWVAWWSPLSGLALVPLADLALPLALGGAILVAWGAPAPVLWPAGQVLHALAWLAAAWADVGRSLPPLPTWLIPAVGLGLAVALAVARIGWASAVAPRRALLGGLAALVAAAWLGWAFGRPAARTLEVTFLDVGEGDAAFIRTPSGEVLVVDGGNARLAPAPSPEERGGALADLLSFRRVERIDLVVATHPDADHFHGLVPVVEAWPVAAALYSGRPADTDAWRRFRAALREEGAPLAQARAGTVFRLPDGVRLEVLNPPAVPPATPHPDNDLGVVLRLVYGRVSFLFTADVEATAEAWLLRSRVCLASTVLKVPHHGSRTSSTAEFLRAVAPAFAVLSVGPNRYGLPDEDVLARYRDLGIPLLRTDEGGAVIVRTDGERLWLARGGGRPAAWPAPPAESDGRPARGEAAACRESGAGTGGGG